MPPHVIVRLGECLTYTPHFLYKVGASPSVTGPTSIRFNILGSMLDKFDKDGVECPTYVRTGFINSPVDKFDKDGVECST